MTTRPPSTIHKESARGSFSVLLVAIGLAVFVAGVGVGCYNGFQWLQTGQSHQLVLKDVIGQSLPSQVVGWIAHPGSWFGLHAIVLWLIHVPLFACLLFLGFIILIASTA